MIKRKLKLRIGKARFGGVLLDRESRQLFIRWVAPSEVSNIICISMIVFRLGWPTVRWMSVFISTDN